MINLPGSSLEYPRYSQEYLNHATFAPPRGGRLGGVGWLPRRARTDGRVKLPGPRVRAGYKPCTFEQQTLFEDHSQHTFDRWCVCGLWSSGAIRMTTRPVERGVLTYSKKKRIFVRTTTMREITHEKPTIPLWLTWCKTTCAQGKPHQFVGTARAPPPRALFIR